MRTEMFKDGTWTTGISDAGLLWASDHHHPGVAMTQLTVGPRQQPLTHEPSTSLIG